MPQSSRVAAWLDALGNSAGAAAIPATAAQLLSPGGIALGLAGAGDRLVGPEGPTYM